MKNLIFSFKKEKFRIKFVDFEDFSYFCSAMRICYATIKLSCHLSKADGHFLEKYVIQFPNI